MNTQSLYTELGRWIVMLENNPYQNVDWQSFQKVMSVNHVHPTYSAVQSLYDLGIRHLPFSAYYPSSPTYPLTDHYDNVPSDLLSSPNAEHHGATNGYEHFLSMGSFFSSGSPNGQTPLGVADTWQNAYAEILNNLQYEDAGGIIIAHPSAALYNHHIARMDFDDRVLGVEIYGHSGTRHGVREDGTYGGTFLGVWDRMLSTGRRVYGYCTIDHTGYTTDFGKDLGRNMLLVPEYTEYACLKAYRNGASYGALHGNRYAFTKIEATNQSVSVMLDKEVNIKVITNDGVVKESFGSELKYQVNDDDIYVRIEATEMDETLYSQAIMYKSNDEVGDAPIENSKKITRDKRRRFVILS